MGISGASYFSSWSEEEEFGVSELEDERVTHTAEGVFCFLFFLANIFFYHAGFWWVLEFVKVCLWNCITTIIEWPWMAQQMFKDLEGDSMRYLNIIRFLTGELGNPKDS